MKYYFKPLVLPVLFLLLPALPGSAQVKLLPDRIGIGNTDPDEELVIGENIDFISYLFPAVTIGNAAGGVLALGNEEYRLALESNNSTGRALLAASSPDGYGFGEISVRANGGLAIGVNPGSANGYMIKAVHNSFGLLLERYESPHDWELYTNLSGQFQLFYDGSFRGQFDPVTGTYSSTSDRRLKRGIADMAYVLDRVMQLQPSSYRYADGDKDSRQTIGFIAQDVEPLFPEIVHISKGDRTDGTYTLDYAGFGTIAIKAIQELKGEIDSRDDHIAELEDRLVRIERLLKHGQTAQNYLTLNDRGITPGRIELQQNQPNPFGSVTIINYTIPAKIQHAQLRITDTSGRLLRSMDIKQRGPVQTVLNAGDHLPAGAYYYSLWIDGEMVGSKKMMLNKYGS